MFILDFLNLLILYALGPSLVCTDIFPITNNTRELKEKVDLKKKSGNLEDILFFSS